ncbi:hypothetical protein Tco_0800898 [Tanacetum coccineum]|uniref:Uncharacterized protein n=1 Tax=Tanacetum coccineum TaxID=301880 RepID=A0ABQ4ZUG2_9ASTR
MEGPFHMGTVSDVIVGGTEGAVQQGPVRARVLNDLSAEKKESNIVLWKQQDQLIKEMYLAVRNDALMSILDEMHYREYKVD